MGRWLLFEIGARFSDKNGQRQRKPSYALRASTQSVVLTSSAARNLIKALVLAFRAVALGNADFRQVTK